MEELRQPMPEEYRDEYEVSVDSAITVMQPMLNEVLKTVLREEQPYFTAEYLVDDRASGAIEQKRIKQRANVFVEVNDEHDKRFTFSVVEAIPQDDGSTLEGIRSVQVGEDELEHAFARSAFAIGEQKAGGRDLDDRTAMEHVLESGIHRRTTQVFTPEDFEVVVEAAQMTGVIANKDPELQKVLWQEAERLK